MDYQVLLKILVQLVIVGMDYQVSLEIPAILVQLVFEGMDYQEGSPGTVQIIPSVQV